MAAAEDSYSFLVTIGRKEECEPGELILRFKYWRVVTRVMGNWVAKELEAAIKVFRKNRSDRQNRYMWGVVVPTVRSWMKETSGKDEAKEAVYYWIRRNVIGDEIKVEMIHGKEVVYMGGKRFSQMTTAEFAECVDTILKYFAEQGCIIPVPKGENTVSEHVEDEWRHQSNL